MLLLTLTNGPQRWQTIATPHSYSEALKQTFAAIPGLRWNKARNAYIGCSVATDAAAKLLADASIVTVRDLREKRFGFERTPCVAPIYPFQREGVEWLVDMLCVEGAALLSDDMGLGKSAQALHALDTCTSGPVVVVCPAIVLGQWRRELSKWNIDAGRYHLYSYEGFQIALKGGSKKNPPLPASPAAIVFDEAHYLQSGLSKRGAASRLYCEANPRMLRLALSGTPMTARPRDLHNVLNILWPGRFGSFGAFTRRYSAAAFKDLGRDAAGEPLAPVWDTTGASNLEELSVRLAPCMLRRTKAEVALQLPQKVRTIIEVELPAAARRGLKALSATLDFDTMAKASVGSLLSGVELYKVDAAASLAETLVAGGSKVLLLTTRKQTAEALSLRLKAPCATGDVEASRRVALLQDAPIGVATIYSVTTGIDLVSYNAIIFVGLDWVPTTLLQAEDRIHRLSSTHASVSIFYLVALGTLDEIVRSRVIERLDNAATVLNNTSESAAFAGLDDESILNAMCQEMQQ